MYFSSAAKLHIEQEIQVRDLPVNFMATVERWYLPLAQQLANLKANKSGSIMISFNGAQGSGKSTMTAFLRLILKHQFQLNTLEVSIDDFYLTRSQRETLSRTVHPLLVTRGVPGTHDVELALQTFTCLMHAEPENPCYVPVFDKSVDDRRPQKEWLRVDERVDIILFEGWCNHAPVQDEIVLKQPVNELERDEDEQAVWRSYVNKQLRHYHEKLFELADFLVFLRVPSFEKVYEWRGLQEAKLASSEGEEKKGLMTATQLKRFIQHYERITRACLDGLPASADVVVQLNDKHLIESMEFKTEEANHV